VVSSFHASVRIIIIIMMLIIIIAIIITTTTTTMTTRVNQSHGALTIVVIRCLGEDLVPLCLRRDADHVAARLVQLR
jgi:uncharacterized membrane protein affecting hemolysin expression